MASPFELFRKNQKTLMALLLIFAMFAFILMGMFSREAGLNLPVLGLVLGAAVFTLVGVLVGRPIPYAAGGALGGLLAGVVLAQSGAAPGSEFQVETKIGNLTPREFQRLVRQRSLVNQFIARAQETAGTGNPMTGGFRINFGQPLERDIVMGMIFRDLAQKNGIRISPQAVNDFIESITSAPPEPSEDGEVTGSKPVPRLSKEGYHNILSDMQISPAQLTKALQSELLAVVGSQQFQPRQITTPEQFWESYRKMNLAESLQVVAVPVSAFAQEIADPGDAALKPFFEMYKSTPSLSPQVPGFYQPRKIQLAYLEASSLDVEATIPEITDEKIKEHYEANKDTLYRNRTVPEGGPSSAAPGDSSVPTLPDFEDLKDIAPDADQPKSDRPESGDALKAPKVEDSTDTPEPPPDDCSFDEPAADADEKPAEKPAAEAKDSDAPSDEKPLAAPKVEQATSTEEAPLVAPKPTPKYRPLDEFLKMSIRDELLREETRKKQEELHAKAFAEMQKLSDEYFAARTIEDPQRRKAAVDEFVASVRGKLKKFAEDNGLYYGRTELLNRIELSESGEHPVGGATIGTSESGSGGTTVADQFFSLPPDSLYEPHAAHSQLPSSLYAVWKIEDVAEHEPKFEEVREQVLEAWKIDKARPKAKDRAEELAEELEKVEGTWSEYLAELPDEKKTVTGKPEGVVLSTRITESFSWIRQQSVPTQTMFGTIPIQRPVLSEISAVENAGNAFMETIFDGMQDGEVGVVPNDDSSIFYVVQVRDRHFSGQSPDSGLAHDKALEAQYQAFLQTDLFANQIFSQSPYLILAQMNSSAIGNRWLGDLMSEYDVKFNSSAEMR